jgi:hypothetical protein
VGSLSPQHGASSGCGWWNGLQLWRLAANIFNKQPRTDNKGWSSSLGLGVGLTTLHHKNKLVTKKSNSLGAGQILWINDPSYRIWIRDLKRGMLEVCVEWAP